jgi:carboxyl-terminal processing protease
VNLVEPACAPSQLAILKCHQIRTFESMSRKIKWAALTAALLFVIVAFRKPTEKYFEIAKSLDIFATLFKEVNAYYVDNVEPQKLVRQGIDGMLQSLDPYTDYIPEDQIENFRITTTGQYGGIGALIGVVNNKTVITHPYKEFPAYKAGIKVGDELIAVDGKLVKDKGTGDVSALLKGQPKTEVEVRLKRYGRGDEIVLKIKREKINIGNVSHFQLINNDVGYIRLDDFTPGAGKEVAEALLDLKEKGATKLILDLRDNPGGLLHEAVNIVSLFIPKGMDVVSTKGKVEEWNKTYTTLNAPIDTEMPVAILANENSASASEIVAGSLQDYDRAVLIGRKTFGKGLVQTTRALAYNAQLKVTTAKYYIPSGRCIQALDYTHRKEDGTVHKVADSLKKEFQTKAGRVVYDGGGLDPDITVKEQYVGSLTEVLLANGLIFEYASQFINENPQFTNLRDFALTDEQYSYFTKWLVSQNFKYTTEVERSAKELVEAAKEEQYYSEIEQQLSQIKKKIEASKVTDLTRYKPEIKGLLEQQIAFHYDLVEGQASVALKNDEAIKQAFAVLNNQNTYKSILTPKQ